VNKVDYRGGVAITLPTVCVFFTLIISATASESVRLSETYSVSIPLRDPIVWEAPKIREFPTIQLPKVDVVSPNTITISIPEYEIGSVWNRVKINKISVDLIKRKISNKIKTKDGKIDLNKFSKKPNNGPPKWIGPLGYELVKDMTEHKGKAYKLFQYGIRIATVSWDGIILGK